MCGTNVSLDNIGDTERRLTEMISQLQEVREKLVAQQEMQQKEVSSQ
jgi:hypothetical protein